MELSISYLSIVVMLKKIKLPETVLNVLLFGFGFSLFFFDSQAIGFFIHDVALMKENLSGVVLLSIAGILGGFLPLLFYRYLKRLPIIEKALSLPVMLVFTGAYRLTFGGLGELTKEDIIQTLNRGFSHFLEGTVSLIQKSLILQPHPFIDVPLTGIFNYLSSDRMAMTLTVLTIMTPPIFVLIKIFASPDPLLHTLKSRAEKRLRIAEFRKELSYRSFLPVIGFVLLVVMLHTSSFAVNPLYDPPPLPVRTTNNGNKIIIPLSSKLGELTDGMLHKYVYIWGNKEIVFLAIVKPDGTVGLALDQCEICRPAEWNKEAQGYAQKGKHLVCKYCMTPIATETVNKPGGCNPIPVPFKVQEDSIVISVEDLVRTFSEAEKLQKKGTHL
jgi:uncharacterized membrane protein